VVKPNGIAKRMRNSSEEILTSATFRETVVCGNCGQRFSIQNDAGLQDAELAARQAAWVTDQLVWDHIQERKHHGTIDLPDLSETCATR
jgi:transcription elongation factor Elf1